MELSPIYLNYFSLKAVIKHNFKFLEFKGLPTAKYNYTQNINIGIGIFWCIFILTFIL